MKIVMRNCCTKDRKKAEMPTTKRSRTALLAIFEVGMVFDVGVVEFLYSMRKDGVLKLI